MIDTLADSHEGLMPIRVLQHNLIYEFENMSPSFLELSKKVVNELGLSTEIIYSCEEISARSPFVVFGKISLHESFLSYVWCNCYSLSILYSEVIVKKSVNDFFGQEVAIIDKAKAIKAYRLWEYAISLVSSFSVWDTNTPNPEKYDVNDEEDVLRINSLYLTAMKFVIAHEFAHIELQHSIRTEAGIESEEVSRRFEIEADARAVELLLQGQNNENIDTIRIGLLLGLCSLLFFSSVAKGKGYPDMDDRIDAILDKFQITSQDAMWGIATLAYKLWDVHYKKNLVWTNGLESPKDLYESIKAQIPLLD
jgi:hypothetical protein